MMQKLLFVFLILSIYFFFKFFFSHLQSNFLNALQCIYKPDAAAAGGSEVANCQQLVNNEQTVIRTIEAVLRDVCEKEKRFSNENVELRNVVSKLTETVKSERVLLYLIACIINFYFPNFCEQCTRNEILGEIW